MRDDLARLIVEKCFAKYSKLPKKGKPKDTEWTVLASVVLVRDSDICLVSLATGTKCLDGVRRRSCESGALLHDSHAEVLARRGFLLWLLQQVELAEAGRSQYVLKSEAGLVLSPEYEVVMMSTCLPCGDASIFVRELDEPQTKRPRLDQARTGAKPVTGCDPLRPGLDYHATSQLRTKPGRGERTLSLSCSDKILKWNLLGLQGSLLSFLLSRNIYLDSFIIADKTFSSDSMARAFFGRAEWCDVNQPSQVQVDTQFADGRSEARPSPCPDSLIWVASEEAEGRHEAVTDGHKQGWPVSKLDNCKSWSMLCQRNITRKFLQLYQGDLYSTYEELKKHSRYQSAKEALQVEILKSWPVKTISSFSLDKL